MKNTIHIILSVFLSLLVQCNNGKGKDFERELELANYLSNIHGISIENYNGYVFILQAGFCGACTNEVTSFIDSFFSNNQVPSIFIFSKDQELLTKKFKSYKNSRTVIDRDFNLEKYGLITTSDFLLKYESGHIASYYDLKRDSFDKIKRIENL